ncbi:glycosyltransferase [Tepidibacter mesophilus]|uniref:glycosyltransferase n=1 Tax=Tepidibacter mesophilus TaxID=655607 RepID=UPI000C06C57A|nr:glycosyltransferase [Tepidibacter mesophilus]
MKRILHYGLSNSLGGIETYLLKISQYIDKKIYKFAFIINGDKKPCFYKELSELGCEFYFITPRGKNYNKNIQELNALFRTIDFDILHCHLNSLSYITPINIALKHGKKVIVHSRNAGCLKSFKSKILHKINYNRLPKEKIKLTAVSDLAGEWMFGKNSEVTVLNNGLDTKQYCFSNELREKIRTELNVGNKTIIIHVGAFRAQKNHVKVVEIFSEYLKLNPESILILIGAGELQNEVKELVESLKLSSKVLFLGKRSDISAILSAGDYYLFPSFYEGFPNALLEAETSGLFCFASDTITKEAIIDDLCISLPLDLSANEWANEIIKKSKISDREKCPQIIEKHGLGIEQEIHNLCELYEKY